MQQRTEKLEQANQSIQELNARLSVENQKLVEARQMALSAAESKSLFLANMSHEIRTPMNAIVGMTDILENTQLDLEQKEYLNTIRSSGNTLLTLINDILDFSKIEAKKLILEQREIDLRQCVEGALSLVSGKVADKQLNLIYFFDDAVPQCIIGDSTRLQQIIVNLLSNAVKFTDNGEIQVHIQAKPITTNKYQIQFTVQDTGIGISSDKIEQLFQAFTQADTSTTRKYGGTGLGLAISKQLCELMNGQIWVESQVQVGSTFHFMIQASITQSKPQQFLYDSHPQLSGKSLCLLNLLPSNQKLIIHYATRWGMQVMTEPMPTADIVLVELNKPDQSFTLIADKPLIVLTYLCTKSYRQVPFTACLNKPIHPKRLLEQCLQILTTEQIKQPTIILKQDETNQTELNILLVDDNAVNRKVGLLQLKQLGYQADTAVDGLDAIENLCMKRYDVVLMDMQMPKMDGIEATKVILATWSETQRPWIIAMTANAMNEDKEKCFAIGMQDYISKPVRIPELKAALLRVPKLTAS